MKGKLKTFFSRDRKTLYMILSIVLISIFSLTIVYAALSVTLNIQGNAEVVASTWDIHLDNVKVTSGSVSGTAPSITTPTTATFSTTLNTPGDFYEFTIDVVNDGSIDAMIDGITKTPTLTETQAKYLNYIIEYQNGESINTKQLVAKNSYVRLKVRVEFRKDITASDLPTTSETLNLAFTVNYVQSDGTGSSVTNDGRILPEVEYSFSPADYDAKMGTTTSTDSSVVIPESFEYNENLYKVTSIAQRAFRSKYNLISLTINANLTKIGDSAFQGASGLVSIYYYGTTAPQCSLYVFYETDVSIYVTDSYESDTFCGQVITRYLSS